MANNKNIIVNISSYFVFSSIFVSCVSINENSKETHQNKQTFCLDMSLNNPQKYPVCSDKSLENQICALTLSQLKPTQFNFGKEYVEQMYERFKPSIENTQQFLCSKPVSIVIGPKVLPGFFLTDGHHRMKMIEQFENESGNQFTILVQVAQNFKKSSPDMNKTEFWNVMLSNNDVYLKDNGVVKTTEELPVSLQHLTNDPYRSLTAFIADDRSKFCFDKSLPSYGNFAEFYWGDYFRSFANLEEYNDYSDYKLYKNKILYFNNQKTGKRENICKLQQAENLPGYTDKDNEPSLVLDYLYQEPMPKNFRTTNDYFKINGINKKGLKNLNASGSAQFSQEGLEWIINNTSKNLIVIDLRQESHGFINGNPVSWLAPLNWANIDKSKNNIIIDESVRLKELNFQKVIELPLSQNYKDGTLEQENFIRFDINTVLREDEVAQKLSVGYRRFTVRDRLKPSDEEVESFLKFYKTLNSDTWLHFHCKAGKGRTTTFLAMYDMLKNADTVSLEDIIHRHASVEPHTDLFSIQKEYKKDLLIERKEFLINFHKYAKALKKGYKGSWKSWITLNS
ncbi:ParB-like protein [Silvanigrella aquatica]|uniref:Tyrosine specific protein phosphatases domain-containing protein n=1 Tax=Silvanigrella aquatica TaxID=1915309 RepID=A0A1L4CY39_9BACT|nr:ParB-like protein [Silvanigrella aquatica]APJ02872.1 hypothetical protein AXG55_02625 [Silvanigrella aquatica]